MSPAKCLKESPKSWIPTLHDVDSDYEDPVGVSVCLVSDVGLDQPIQDTVPAHSDVSLADQQDALHAQDNVVLDLLDNAVALDQDEALPTPQPSSSAEGSPTDDHENHHPNVSDTLI